ncbi:MAG: serine/threonine-protein kinase [Candidatus Eremiobacteraeota bacterium]|nr:serine/threonine-protein kinase [Candidatus Eremiobacteraeota bacterium]
MMKLVKGSLVNERYEVDSPIKSGGMGAVYKAFDTHFRRREVALKEMLQEFSSQETFELVKKKFEEEANILVILNHRGIPRVIDYFTVSGVCYIVMDFIEGTNLEKLVDEYLSLTGKPVPEYLAAEYAVQICEVLHYLHSHKPNPIIHRDVKPGNIILHKKSREVFLVDFGLARGIDSQSLSTKTLVGTVGYAPLEQFKGKPDTRSDIYGLGATMHHLISGKRPAPLAIEPLESVYPQANSRLAAIVDRAIAENPDDRFQTVLDFKDALVEVLPALRKMEADDAEKAPRNEENGVPTKVAAEKRMEPALRHDGRTYADDSIDERVRPAGSKEAAVGTSGWWTARNYLAAGALLLVLLLAAFLVKLTAGHGGVAGKKDRAMYTLFDALDREMAADLWDFLGEYGEVQNDERGLVLLVPKSEGAGMGYHRSAFVFAASREALTPGEITFKLRFSEQKAGTFIFFWGSEEGPSLGVELIDTRGIEEAGKYSARFVHYEKGLSFEELRKAAKDQLLTGMGFNPAEGPDSKGSYPSDKVLKDAMRWKISFRGERPEAVFLLNDDRLCALDLPPGLEKIRYFGMMLDRDEAFPSSRAEARELRISPR